ncbi:MAG: hypothetical protein JW966_04655 [Anaerolineae bacterium]|nr:hypothetical protein [Anaerolineae bacterium]
MSAREKLLQARELIQQQRYAEAREILVTIDHPKAREWLSRIDDLAISTLDFPEVKPTDKSDRQRSTKKPTGCRKHCMGFASAFGLLMILCVFVVLIATGDSDSAKVRSWWDGVQPLINKFHQQEAEAALTPRIALTSILLEMESTRSEFNRISAPSEAATAKRRISDAMDKTLDGYWEFANGATESQVERTLEGADRAWSLAYDEIDKLDDEFGLE